MRGMRIETASKSYPLWIGGGLRHQLSSLFRELPQSYASFLIISDDRVAGFYLDDVLQGLGNAVPVHQYVVDHGEEAKSFEVFYHCQTFALEKGLDRKSAILALGGGVVGDLAGFVAATFMRGIGFIQLPTTLLAQDSSVGGKTAINHPLGKNLIGCFYQPDAVIYDTETLATLPASELRSGFAEMIKHGLIYDPSLYRKLKQDITSADDLAAYSFEEVIKPSIDVKAAIVRQDEKEIGVRSHLNFGHTLGHAIEAELGYGNITHGEAVALGMIFAMEISEVYFQSSLPISDFKRWLGNLGFLVTIPQELDPERLFMRMKHDKKTEHFRIRFVVMKDIGEVETVFLEDALILRHLGIDRNERIR